MGLVEKWNKLARKKIYINESFEIGVGRLVYMCLLNCFITIGMILSSTTPSSVVWLWVDLLGSFKKKEKS